MYSAAGFFYREIAHFKGALLFRHFQNSKNEENPLLNFAQKMLLVTAFPPNSSLFFHQKPTLSFHYLNFVF